MKSNKSPALVGVLACLTGLWAAHAQPKTTATESAPASQPSSSAWPFDGKEAARRQDDAARSLGVEKEISLDLGNKARMKLTLLPAGKFMMGKPGPERIVDFGEEERPYHEVTITKPFYVGTFEVTRGQFAAFVADTGYQTDAEKAGQVQVWNGLSPKEGGKYVWKPLSWRKAGFEQTDDHPVVYVSWDDAYEFCEWLSKKTGRPVSLPTEAQWEYACRAGTDTSYPWGDDLVEGWYNGSGSDDGFAFTAPVGKYKPNAFGLYDMIGNVDEWCADWNGSGYPGYNPKDKTDPKGPDVGCGHMVRGGHWGGICTSFKRFGLTPKRHENYLGFRIVMAAERPSPQPTTTESTSRPGSQPSSSAWPFDVKEAARRQQETSKSLGVAKEIALVLSEKKTMKFILIPAGRFLMGVPEEEKKRFPDAPPHDVRVTKPFYIGITHVTRGQFAAFVADSGYKTDAERNRDVDLFRLDTRQPLVFEASWKKPGFAQNDRHPAVCISHNDAVAFSRWLSKKTGRNVALPSEAQFEYACRAGTSTDYPWGDDPNEGEGWCNAADETLLSAFPSEGWGYQYFRWVDGYVFTSPEGAFKPNAFGLYDMIGNACQWCADWYDEGYYVMSPRRDPPGPNVGTKRVLRGRSFRDGARACRSAARWYCSPGWGGHDTGFRVIVSDIEKTSTSSPPASRPATQTE